MPSTGSSRTDPARVSISFLVSILLLVISSFAQSGEVCTANQYDMMQWLVMSPQLSAIEHLVGNANPHYDLTTASYAVSIKGAQGYPWDIDTYDAQQINQWITEFHWNDPTTFKAFTTPLPWMPRCIDIPSVSGKLSSFPSPTVSYSIYSTGCEQHLPLNLGPAITEVWGPYSAKPGFPSQSPYLALSYRYDCDGEFDNCTYKEEFDYQQDLGMVEWTLYKLSKGIYRQKSQSTFTTIVAGGTPPLDFPCPLP